MNTHNDKVKSETVAHTPGPWRFDGMWSLIMAGKYEIAAVHAARTVEETRKRKRLDETNANARLIAAAPDLLKASKALMAELQSRFDYVEPTPEESAALCKMEAAIERATP